MTKPLFEYVNKILPLREEEIAFARETYKERRKTKIGNPNRGHRQTNKWKR